MKVDKPDFYDLQAWQQSAEAEGRECVIGAVISNAHGQAFVQKRSLKRRLFPGCWNIVGGHIEPGETAYDGLRREIFEETGWRLKCIVAVLGQWDWAVGQHMKRELDLLVDVEGDLANPQLEWSKLSAFRWITLNELDILNENRDPGDTFIYDVVRKGLELEQRRSHLMMV